MRDTQQLPPLILHPFSGGSGTDALLDGSLASLTLEGLFKPGNSNPDGSRDAEIKLVERILTGRYQEVRMLLFLGKDVFRWLRQCTEHAQSAAAEPDPRIVEQSFAALLVEDPPETVKWKLEQWGVTDRRAVFSRAIGIHSIFEEPPPASSLSPNFLRNYHRYADHAYVCYQHSSAFLPLEPSAWQFELFASEEYARVISEAWNLDT